MILSQLHVLTLKIKIKKSKFKVGDHVRISKYK